LRRIRRLPRQRLHADPRLAVQRAAVPERAAYGGDAAADAARRRRCVRRRPRRRGRVRARAACGRGVARERRDLRRLRRDADGGGRRADSRRDDGPARCDAGRPGSVTPDDICLAIDLGTGGPKVGFVRLSGEILWHEHQPVETHWLPGGGATQDAVAWWALIRDAVRRGLASGAVPADQVVAVGCTGQWASTVPVGDGGEPVGDCILWMDTRGGAYSRAVIGGPVAVSKLAPLVPTGSVVGTVLPEVARELGISQAARVVTGVPDLHSAACGAGAIEDFETHLAVSTSAWIGAPVPFKKTDPLHS